MLGVLFKIFLVLKTKEMQFYFLSNLLNFKLSRQNSIVEIGVPFLWEFRIIWELRLSIFGSTGTHLLLLDVEFGRKQEAMLM